MYAGNGEGSHWGGREGSPVFSNCLQSSAVGLSPRSMWGTQVPSTIVDGEHVFGCSLGHFPSVTHCRRGTWPWNSPSNCIGSPHIQMVMPFIWGGSYKTCYSYQGPTHQKWKEGKFLVGLKGNCQVAFCWDSDLVWVTRQRYFKAHHPTFNQEGSHNLSGLSWEMVTCTDLLDSEIYEIQEVWTRQKDLQYANDALKSLPKGLSLYHPVFPLESPKVMGQKGIHHPNALCHHVGLSYCPWCRKEGQNEGTVVNHLQTMHYKLGLVCSGCLYSPQSPQRPYGIMAQAVNTLVQKRKMEGPAMTTHPHQTNFPQAVVHTSSTHHTIMYLN